MPTSTNEQTPLVMWCALRPKIFLKHRPLVMIDPYPAHFKTKPLPLLFATKKAAMTWCKKHNVGMRRQYSRYIVSEVSLTIKARR